jgi:hypothetical protein
MQSQRAPVCLLIRDLGEESKEEDNKRHIFFNFY